jgi:hypothetical protein
MAARAAEISVTMSLAPSFQTKFRSE